MKIIWLASYPKSGNTFLRFLLYHYFFGDIESSLEVEYCLPDLHVSHAQKRNLEEIPSEHLFVKTHLLYGERHTYMNHCVGFIYILRNPRDVLLSNSRYRSVISAADYNADTFADDFIKNMGVPLWSRQGIGNWAEHVASWSLGAIKRPGIFIRYEDLRYDTENTFSEVLRFLELKPDMGKIRAAVEGTCLSRMKALERREQNSENFSVFGKQLEGQPFVGEGKTGQPLDCFGPHVEKAFKRRFGNLMKLYGYHH